MFTKAFSPEQSAQGQLADGREILILYVKELAQELNQVNQQQISHFKYDWFANEGKSEYVLHIEWVDGPQISIQFKLPHKGLLDYLSVPRDVIITALPIPQLVEQSPDGEALNLTGPIASCSGLYFSDPDTLQ